MTHLKITTTEGLLGHNFLNLKFITSLRSALKGDLNCLKVGCCLNCLACVVFELLPVEVILYLKIVRWFFSLVSTCSLLAA